MSLRTGAIEAAAQSWVGPESLLHDDDRHMAALALDALLDYLEAHADDPKVQPNNVIAALRGDNGKSIIDTLPVAPDDFDPGGGIILSAPGTVTELTRGTTK